VAAPFVDITTIAGLAGTPGNADGTNTGALFNTPCGIAVDNNTNVYVADKLNHVIRMLALSGTNWVSSTIAGLAGNPGSANGTNGNARFTAPCGVAVDGAGNVYVADTGNSTIRKLTPSGTNWVVSTISGLAGSPGTNNGSGSVARFHYPMGLAVDSDGSVYVADQANYNIRKLTPSGAIWTASTIAGASTNSSNDGINNAAGFGQPYGVAVDTNGIVYVVDRWGPTIRKVAAGVSAAPTASAVLPGLYILPASRRAATAISMWRTRGTIPFGGFRQREQIGWYLRLRGWRGVPAARMVSVPPCASTAPLALPWTSTTISMCRTRAMTRFAWIP
jgi:sugar lactone lactonase YvrE